MTKFSLFLVLLFSFSISFSQAHITGTVTLDIEKGYIHCEYTLSNLPKLNNYKILLNRGMNVKYFKDVNDSLISYEGYYDGKIKGEALEYYFVDNENKAMGLGDNFKMEYSGAFPVYNDSFNGFDFKGYIAINDKTLRATEQTKWYPVIYDVENDKLLDRYSYDITVINKTDKSVFINGSPPHKGSKSSFKTQKAFPLFLFVGDYDYTEVKGDYLINADVSKEVAAKIFENINGIKKYYERLLDISFKDDIYLINHKAVKDLKNGDWGFNTYPAFGFSNLDFNNLFAQDGSFEANKYKFFAHELAHNYFGNNVNSGDLSWFWMESSAEYLSLVALEDYSSSDNVNEYYNYYLKETENKGFIALNEITEGKQINYNYRYMLGPLIYKAFELSFGKEKTIKTIKSLLELSHNQTLTLKSWEEAAVKNGVTEKAFKEFRVTYLSGKKFDQNIVKLLSKSVLKN